MKQKRTIQKEQFKKKRIKNKEKIRKMEEGQ